MTIQQLLEAAVEVEREIEATPAGSPRFADIVTRIANLQGELERTRSVQGALIPDQSRAPSADEQSSEYLGKMLRSLLEAASSKR